MAGKTAEMSLVIGDSRQLVEGKLARQRISRCSERIGANELTSRRVQTTFARLLGAFRVWVSSLVPVRRNRGHVDATLRFAAHPSLVNVGRSDYRPTPGCVVASVSNARPPPCVCRCTAPILGRFRQCGGASGTATPVNARSVPDTSRLPMHVPCFRLSARPDGVRCGIHTASWERAV